MKPADALVEENRRLAELLAAADPQAERNDASPDIRLAER